jgi:hypothetical protein
MSGSSNNSPIPSVKLRQTINAKASPTFQDITLTRVARYVRMDLFIDAVANSVLVFPILCAISAMLLGQKEPTRTR